MHTDPFDLLAATTAAWGMPLSEQQRAQFATYAAELQHWNRRANLTAITDSAQIVTRHFLDSLVCARFWGSVPARLIDVGSGAGFPGVPLKLLCPALHLTLVESVGKKTAFLQHLAATLELEHVAVLTARAEQVAHDVHHRASYDVAAVRAVADLRAVAEYALPLLRIGGRLLAPKGADVAHEVERAQHAIELLGGRLHAVERIALPDVEPRTLVLIDKIAETPAAYPRAVGVPARRPL
jgi:16S rRNA (guanine527-N7)-methyltransferase